jgi:uroporphyrinogen decarboxylase
LFDTYCLPYLSNIAKGVKAGLKAQGIEPVPMVIFPKGSHYAIEKLVDSGYDVIGLDWTIDPKEARLQTDNKITLQGNLDPCALYGPPEVIRASVKKMLEGFGTQKLIANLGHGMHPDHNPERLGVFLTAIHEISSEMNAETNKKKPKVIS